MVFAAFLVIPWLVAMALTPATIRFAQRYDLLDRPTERKAHQRPVAMLGGVAILLSTVLGLALLAPFVPELRGIVFGSGSLGALAVGTTLMVALGLWDDLYDMTALHKFAGQVAIAALTYAMGFQAGAIELPFGFELSDAAPISFLVTVVWITAIANAFNLIDGMDGLAAGVALITALASQMNGGKAITPGLSSVVTGQRSQVTGKSPRCGGSAVTCDPSPVTSWPLPHPLQ